MELLDAPLSARVRCRQQEAVRSDAIMVVDDRGVCLQQLGRRAEVAEMKREVHREWCFSKGSRRGGQRQAQARLIAVLPIGTEKIEFLDESRVPAAPERNELVSETGRQDDHARIAIADDRRGAER